MSIVDLIAAAGLTGRGGAAFSTATKVSAAQEHRARLVVNACDGELGAAKDGWVVEHHLAALVEGARLVTPPGRAVTYAAHRGSAAARRLASHGLPVLEVPARYVSSEESSLVSLLHGGLARPMTKRTPFVLGGADSAGRRVPPTLVLNAETVWRVAQVAARGPQWFRASGTAEEPGPRLVTVAGRVARPGVQETQAGVPVAELLRAAGGLAPDVGSVLVGGLGGVFLTAAEAHAATWSTAALRPLGASVGPGVLDVVDPHTCPLLVVDRMLAYAAGESAGQCGPCMFGLPAVAADWHELATRPSRGVHDRLRGRLGLLPGRGACHFPDGVARFAASALRVHQDHLGDHVAGRCDLVRSGERALVG